MQSCLESCIGIFNHPHVQPVLCSLVRGVWAGDRRHCSANWEGFPTSPSGAVLASGNFLLFATFGPFFLSLRQFCRICLEVGMDVERLTSGGKKLFSWIPVRTQSLAAYLNHHRVQTKHPYFSVVLEALCFSEKEGKEGCPTPCPTVQLFSQDNPCMVTAPGLCSSLLGGMQGMAHGGYLPSFQCCRG